MDKSLADGIMGMVLAAAKHSQERVQGLFDAIIQNGATIAQVLTLQHGGVGDDPALLMALQAAAGVPSQGAVTQAPK